MLTSSQLQYVALPQKLLPDKQTNGLPALPECGMLLDMAIRSFRNQATEDINYGKDSKAARRVLPTVLHEKARIKLARLHAAESIGDLATLPGNRLEALKGDRKGQHSIRINDKYRLCFIWQGDAADNVEIVDYH